MKTRFNAATVENREDLSKQILAITLKNVIKKGDFLNMLNLLDIGDCRIQCSVFSAIDAFQLETDLYGRCIMGTEVLRASNCLFELCKKWSIHWSVYLNCNYIIVNTLINMIYMDIYLQNNDSVKLATTCCKYPTYIPMVV